MTEKNIQMVQELLQGATKPDVVNRLVSADAIYVSLTFENPKLKKVMPWAGTHKDGRVTYVQYMEDTFGTGSTFRSGGSRKFQSDPQGGEIEV